MGIGTQIKFHFHPFEHTQNHHAVEKSENGRQYKYLIGIASGVKVDAHGERMTEKCIKSFMTQANSGDILLYPDTHGIKASEDVGILAKAEMLENGDWKTYFRLYDENDNIGPVKLEKINDIWKQAKGMPPYTKARQKGFSIEGIIPDESIIKNGFDQSAIDDVQLDGVCLVPRPAYTDSIATAIYKALGETTPHRRESLVNILKSQMDQSELEDQYYSRKWEYNDVLENTIEQIMIKKNNNKAEELGIVFKEYSDLMTNLIIKSESLFKKNFEQEYIKKMDEGKDPLNVSSALSRLDMYKSLLDQVKLLSKKMED